MYFLALDSIHTSLVFLFLVITFGMLSFRVRKHLQTQERITNNTVRKPLLASRIIALVLSSILLGIIFLKPTGLTNNTYITSTGIDCIWLLDTSLSMDIKDADNSDRSISRLNRAKSLIENEMIAHPENRYGLVIFAGKSRMVSPLTTEHSSLLSFLSSIDSQSIQEGGTDFRDALSLTLERFSRGDNAPSNAIVLLSDGGDSDDIKDMEGIKSLFSGKQATLITVGIGQTKPSPIPTGTNPFGETVYKKFQGKVVLSSLNTDSLKKLADIGGGTYVDGNKHEGNVLDGVFQKIAHHDISIAGETGTDMTVQIFTGLSLLGFLIFLLLPSSFLKPGNVSE